MTIYMTDIGILLLGLYIIAHGGIHLIFLGNFKDSKKNELTGWSRKSWLLDKIFNTQVVKVIGIITWILIAVLFAVSGLIILNVIQLQELLSSLLIFVSLLAIGAYILFFDGLEPTPYHWILGVVINFLILVFYAFLTAETGLLLALLLIVWAYGMFIHSKVLIALQIAN